MDDMRAIHREMAVNCFNEAWDLLDKESRTREEDLRMLHAAHCSRYHWGVIGSPLEFQRGEWQISRICSVLGLGKAALFHAEACHETCVREGIGDFDLAFSLESLARAYLVLEDPVKSEKYRMLAEAAAEDIGSVEDRSYFLSELSSISRKK